MSVRILVIDDDPRNVSLIELYLEDEHYELIPARSGEEGWAILLREIDSIDLILLDRMMPGLDGIAFLQRYHNTPGLRRLPVIMQTAASDPDQIREGLRLGVFYYLTKPYAEDVLVSLVRAAIADSRRNQQLHSALAERDRTWSLITHLQLKLADLAEARAVAATVAQLFPDPDRVLTGISEMLINAVEHGNLEISYDEKSTLLQTGQWRQEVQRRLADPRWSQRRVAVELVRESTGVYLDIRDEGPGFDWSNYLELNQDRASDAHGRGIAIARLLSFDEVQYLGRGNHVRLHVRS